MKSLASRSFLLLSFETIISRIISIVTLGLIIRFIESSVYGEITLLFSYYNAYMIVLKFGTDDTVFTEKQGDDVRFTIAFVVGVFISVIGFIFMSIFDAMLLFLVGVLNAYSVTQMQRLRSQKRFTKIAVARFLENLLLKGSIFLVLFDYHVYHVVFYTIVLAAFVKSMLMIDRDIIVFSSGFRLKGLSSEIWKNIPWVATDFFSFSTRSLDYILLSTVVNYEIIGLYAFAYNVVFQLSGIFTRTYNFVFLGETKTLVRSVAFISSYKTKLFFAGMIALVSGILYTLRFALGNYIQSWPIMVVLVFGLYWQLSYSIRAVLLKRIKRRTYFILVVFMGIFVPISVYLAGLVMHEAIYLAFSSLLSTYLGYRIASHYTQRFNYVESTSEKI